MAQELLVATLIMQQKLTDNLISYGNKDTRRLPRTQGKRKPRQPLAVAEAIRESPAAERLEAARRLAGWFAHHINNPLGAIAGNAQLLARRLQRDINDSDALRVYLRYLEEIQSQTERCAHITGEVLDFTRPAEPDIRKVNVRNVIVNAAELVQYVHPGSQIAFDTNNQTDLPAVCADKEWLVRVIFELVSNAVEASAGAVVSIHTDVLPPVRSRPAQVQVKVVDSGPGIDDEVLPRVFDPFFSTREKARGLGLTVSLEMMRKMRGTIQIEKSNCDGCIFTIGIPVWKG